MLTGEAIDVARFLERYWEPTTDPNSGAVILPGFAQLKPKIDEKIIDEILALRALVQQAQTKYLLTVSPAGSGDLDRARFILRELTAVLDFLFDDGEEDERDLQLAKLDNEHEDAFDSQDELAAALEDYAELASSVKQCWRAPGNAEI